MAHYYGRIIGSAKTDATRRGFKSTGIEARADSWTVGARVVLKWSEQLQTDIVTLYHTTGSGSYGSRIMSYAIIDGTFTILDTSYPEVLL